MTKPAHTKGPWRWEFNAQHKSLHIVGGRPMFDLTVMDFERWGMSGATIRLRDTTVGGMNIMHKLHERPDWIAPEPGREHHKRWHQLVTHPDARLMIAAPTLLDALTEMVEAYQYDGGRDYPHVAKAFAAYLLATGVHHEDDPAGKPKSD